MTTLSNRVTKVETEFIAIDDKLNDNATETMRNRDSIHKLRNECNNTFNIIRANNSDLKEIVLNNSHQITSLIEKHEEVKEVVANNTVAMNTLQNSFDKAGAVGVSSIKLISLISVVMGIIIMWDKI